MVHGERESLRKQAKEFSKVNRLNSRIEAKRIDVRIQGIKKILSQTPFLFFVKTETPSQIGEGRRLNGNGH
jgi:hypothetical protein